jgi:hypothetical protein
MEVIKNQASQAVLAVVRASKKINRNHYTKSPCRYKRKFNRGLLPIASDYYSSELKRFYQRKNQATALCPFHDERHPSFSVNLKTGAFICFACGMSGGGIIDFHMKLHNLSFVSACKELGVWHE